jgi:hypothetical protein
MMEKMSLQKVNNYNSKEVKPSKRLGELIRVRYRGKIGRKSEENADNAGDKQKCAMAKS